MVRRRQDHHDFALAFVRRSASRVEQQKQLIARLKKERQPAEQAEADLKEFETTLLTLRNHLEVMQELLKPANLKKCRPSEDDTSRLLRRVRHE